MRRAFLGVLGADGLRGRLDDGRNRAGGSQTYDPAYPVCLQRPGGQLYECR